MKRRLKKTVNSLAGLFGYRISKSDHSNYFDFQALINHHLRKFEKLSFIQVGGCDGISFDPLYPLIKSKPACFEGIILEPVNHYYDELKSRYDNFENINVLKLAVHNEKSEAIIFSPDRKCLSFLPGFAKGVASFDKNHLKKFGISEDKIVSEKVSCISLKALMTSYHLKPDLLVTDTEGYDSEILLHYDFSYHSPPIIHFEHGLSDGIMSEAEIKKVQVILKEAGYEIIFDYYDATAYQMDTLLGAF